MTDELSEFPPRDANGDSGRDSGDGAGANSLHALQDPAEFVARVEPLLAKPDVPALVSLLKSHWTCDQIVTFLGCSHCDARKVAALALSLVGSSYCIPALARQLRDPDPTTNQMAEHALWSIWLRNGRSCEAGHEVCHGAKAVGRRDLSSAMEHFTRAIRLDPDFAEAYNQRAIAKYLAEDYEASIEDCLQTVQRMPCHFGAWAGMAHCHLHAGRVTDAIRCYQRALSINPHLQKVAETLAELRKQQGTAEWV